MTIHAHTNNCWGKINEKKKERKPQQHRLGTNVRVHGFNAGLHQFAPGRS
jgi:hypothetical protein